MVTFWGTCAFFVFGVLGLRRAGGGFNILKLIRLIKDELLIIVGTSSSETVLPRLLAKLEAAGASRQTVGVVIPTGYSFNLDGTCIYLTLGALFIIQASGQDMGIGQQIALAALMILTSKGAAGITGAGLVTLTASLQAFGGEFFTAEAIAVGIALVVGIDRVMSEGRALTNAIGNSVATLVIARWQGELDGERLQAVWTSRRSSTARSRPRSAGGTRTRTRRARSRARTGALPARAPRRRSGRAARPSADAGPPPQTGEAADRLSTPRVRRLPHPRPGGCLHRPAAPALGRCPSAMPSPSTSAARRADVDAPEVLWLGDRRAGDPTLAGGKAASLSRLAARHAVPPGFVVSIPAATLDRRARTAVTSAYRALAESVGEAAPAVAVRSSAVDEDGARASFAGQHDTFLNVAGPEQVWWAVARCVSSFGGDRALAYRRGTGLPDAPARAAVLVQLLVRADAAGVVFSANPVTGARDEAVVNAAWGLGESVVSGTVTPDAIVVGHADGGSARTRWPRSAR